MPPSEPHQSLADSVAEQVHNIVSSELVHQAVTVACGGLETHAEDVGDLFGAVPLGDTMQHVFFTARERVVSPDGIWLGGGLRNGRGLWTKLGHRISALHRLDHLAKLIHSRQQFGGLHVSEYRLGHHRYK